MNSFTSKEVEINAFTFINKQTYKSVPKIITVEDQRYSFVDSGLRYLVQQGQDLIRLFDMSDGQNIYRLKNADNQWTLINIKPLS